MGKITVTFDTNLHKIVPVDPTPEMSAAGFCVNEAEHDPSGVYRAMLAAVPDDLPGVVVHSGEPVAWLRDTVDGSFFATTCPACEGYKGKNDPLFTHPPALPDTEWHDGKVETEGMHASAFVKVWGDAGGGDAGRTALAKYAYALGAKSEQDNALAIMRAALESAAKVCDNVNNHDNPMTASDCADAIRAIEPQSIIDGMRK